MSISFLEALRLILIGISIPVVTNHIPVRKKGQFLINFAPLFAQIKWPLANPQFLIRLLEGYLITLLFSLQEAMHKISLHDEDD